jgi:t-SNARE complex subunit (syntaxin)
MRHKNVHRLHLLVTEENSSKLMIIFAMVSKENNLYSLFTELYKQGQNSEYERALKTASKSKLCKINCIFIIHILLLVLFLKVIKYIINLLKIMFFSTCICTR